MGIHTSPIFSGSMMLFSIFFVVFLYCLCCCCVRCLLITSLRPVVFPFFEVWMIDFHILCNLNLSIWTLFIQLGTKQEPSFGCILMVLSGV
jgi:hypothetical protein